MIFLHEKNCLIILNFGMMILRMIDLGKISIKTRKNQDKNYWGGFVLQEQYTGFRQTSQIIVFRIYIQTFWL